MTHPVETVNAAMKLLSQGFSIGSVAKSMNLDKQLILNWKRKHGVSVSLPNGDKFVKKPQRLKMVQMRHAGMSVYAIAKVLGYPRDVVEGQLVAAGCVVEKKPEPMRMDERLALLDRYLAGDASVSGVSGRFWGGK